MIELITLIGLILSVITALAVYQNKPKLIKLFPMICEGDMCHAIIFFLFCRLIFGIPNGVWGSAYYLLVLVGMALGYAHYLVILTIIPFGISVYLAYQIIAVHQVWCKICLATHVINLALFSHFLTEALH
ncbi:MAG: vitamin K epoxide reductase family protein [Calditrichaeota bacterium]|nr:vitamin K epoxide reductase family protein [Calditrichota bacterium]